LATRVEVRRVVPVWVGSASVAPRANTSLTKPSPKRSLRYSKNVQRE
jgi:hypothetical protein